MQLRSVFETRTISPLGVERGIWKIPKILVDQQILKTAIFAQTAVFLRKRATAKLNWRRG